MAGLGDVAEDDSARQASAAKWQQVIQSTNQAKAALGFIAQELHIAYEAIRRSDADWSTREQMRQILDTTNTYAQQLYGLVEGYETQGISFEDVAPQVGKMIGQLYYDTDHQLQLASKIAAFYDYSWIDNFWEAVGSLPQMAQDAVLKIVDTGKKSLDKAIGWPSWLIPTVATVGVLGVGAWAYFTFFAPVTAAARARQALAGMS